MVYEKAVPQEWTCKKCGHKWISRKFKVPYTCPKCHKFTWNEDKEVQ